MLGSARIDSYFQQLLLALVLTSVSCAKLNSTNYHNCYKEFTCTDNGSIVKWESGVVDFRFDSAVPQEYRTAIQSAAESYNESLIKTSLRVDPDDERAPKVDNRDYEALNEDGINGVYYVKGTWPWSEKIPGSLAVTLTRFSADGILEADLFIKENAIKLSPGVSRDYWIKYLVSHELGHAIGRSHSKIKSSLMYPSLPLTLLSSEDPPPETGKDFFNTYDLKMFHTAY